MAIRHNIFNVSQVIVKLPSMLAGRPLKLHVGSAPALSDTRGVQPKPRKYIGERNYDSRGLR